jgi:heme O synthase-like polyprenyltransferase
LNRRETAQASGRVTRPVSLAVTVLVVILAVYFLMRGAWWVSASLMLADIIFEGFYTTKRRKQRAPNEDGSAV